MLLIVTMYIRIRNIHTVAYHVSAAPKIPKFPMNAKRHFVEGHAAKIWIAEIGNDDIVIKKGPWRVGCGSW